VPGRWCCVWGGRGQTAVSTRGGGTKGKIIRGGGLDGSPCTHLKLGGPAGDSGLGLRTSGPHVTPPFLRGERGVNFLGPGTHLLLALPTHTQDTSSARHHHHRFSKYSSPHRTVRALRPPRRPFCVKKTPCFPLHPSVSPFLSHTHTRRGASAALLRSLPPLDSVSLLMS
jgi:hypothetical protein